MMRKKVLLVLVTLIPVLFLQGYLSSQVQSQEKPLIKAGDYFPEIPLQTPSNSAERIYLGLPEGKTFTFKEIKAELVLVEILSVYCASCQSQAPSYNKLYDLIENDPKSKGRIKMLGIAVGNGDLEIADFRQRYKIPYPIVPDPQFVIHAATGGSRTPFSIFVRQDSSAGKGLVADTHLGTDHEVERLFEHLAALTTTDLAAIRKKGRTVEAKIVHVEPILSEGELQERVKGALSGLGGKLTGIEKLSFKSLRQVYTGLTEEGGKAERFFAEVVSRPSACDACHDLHFIYVFDVAGKVLRFVPLQVTKYENEEFDEDDLRKIRSRIVGKYLSNTFIFDPKVDAVSSATITSALIFDSFSKGKALMDELKGKGLI
jgi:thiol-disulfide isomerase/thioredoxin